jgi:hypothetical protein
MGAPVNSQQTSSAEDTATFSLGQRSGVPAMIPGALERRASAPAAPVVDGSGLQATDRVRAVAVSDRERLVYEREGGGAPSERSGGRPASIFRRLWRRALAVV